MCDRRQQLSVTGHWHQQAHAVHGSKGMTVHGREFKSFNCHWFAFSNLKKKKRQNKQITEPHPEVFCGLGGVFGVWWCCFQGWSVCYN